MGRPWNQNEREKYHAELYALYVIENKTIAEIGLQLSLSEKTVYKRLQVFGIKTIRHKKERYCNRQTAIKIPSNRTVELAEFFGIMLGDGRLSPTQIIVTLGNKERSYAAHVQALIGFIFGVVPKISIRKEGYADVYLGSVVLSRWLQKEGLVHNKVRSQVGVPAWIFKRTAYMRAFLRGLFDTDGSVYRLRHGIQLSYTNFSTPLLEALQNMLHTLKYQPSKISSAKVYITQRKEVQRFFTEIAPANQKHKDRFEEFIRETM